MANRDLADLVFGEDESGLHRLPEVERPSLAALLTRWEIDRLPDYSDQVRDLSIPPPIPPWMLAMSRAFTPRPHVGDDR